MKIVVIGGTGLIGSKLVARLGDQGHEVVAASPSTGVDTVTGSGLAEALVGAAVVVDVSNSPSFADADVLAFFESSTRNVVAAERAAGVGHHVALSVVGADRLPDSGYLRAKVAQEQLIETSGVPWSLVRATQFFEFFPGIADSAMQGASVHLPAALVQPIASDDVVAALAEVAVGQPRNGMVEIAGPEKLPLDEFVRQGLWARDDPREVVTDPAAPYFGAHPTDQSLVLGDEGTLASTRFADWLRDDVPTSR